MKDKNFTLYESMKNSTDSASNSTRLSKPIFLIAFICFFLTPPIFANHFGEKFIENEKLEILTFKNGVEIQEDGKGKFIEIYNSPFLAESEKVISSKLMNNKKVKEVIVNKSDKTITIYFSKDLSDAEIKDFARIYFNK